jgi:hypothetical protein
MDHRDFLKLPFSSGGLKPDDIEGAKRIVEAARFGWNESRNPVFAWVAYRTCRKANLPLPEWVLECLDQGADGMVRLFWNPPTQKNKVAPAIAEALGVKVDGAGSVFARARDSNWVFLGAQVAALVEHGTKDYIAFAELAEEYNISPSTVDRAWKRYQKACKKSGTS